MQGKGVKYPEDNFFVEVQQLCRKHGALLISDEVQCGLGRTGKWFGFQHWDLEPDIITLAKSLSGGYVPVGAIVTRRDIYQKTFSQMDRCVVHSSTFGRNNLAMACGLATLQVIEDETLVENAARMGDLLVSKLEELKQRHSVIKEVRGKGLILAIEFHEPREMAAQARLESPPQDGDQPFHADGRHLAPFPAPDPHASGCARAGYAQNPAPAHDHRGRGR